MVFTLNPITLANSIVEMGDPRTRDYPLVLNPLFVFPLVVCYLYFVKVAGPRWMRDRKPFDIINVVRLYNLFMVVVAAVFLYLHLKMTYLPGGRYNLWCQGITGETDEELVQYYKYGWFFIAVRYADLLDTVFCVLRKKFSQITHLHVIHHTMVTVNVWYYALFAPEGQPALGLAMNAFVHVVMYFYYFLATLGPRIRKHLWWKKYLTTMQIVQFVIALFHICIPLFVDCGFPKYIIITGGLQTLLMLCLFVNFYIKAYIQKGSYLKPSPESFEDNGAMITEKNGKRD
ncbi:elongation of very long chain fatty acids protein AAEL008004-like [Rhipicephalus sanguineus]|uniref:elongation of very long chain fatty acids protein AAEL008004-like n=1 Tax=Rhipicephalus sanguineus TaxID=34632 RepID=UPI001895377A|nr:elongation of very long chain fatty acids protein AAEL008004-like [Rhipicephalus sanguineus]